MIRLAHHFWFQTTVSPLIELLQQKHKATKQTPQPTNRDDLKEATDELNIVLNSREDRSIKSCGSCQCLINNNVAELTQCPSDAEGFLEISNVDNGIVDMKQLLSKMSTGSIKLLIKDTNIEKIKGIEGQKMSHLILENNPKLVFDGKKAPINLNTLEMRTNSVKMFQENAFKTDKLLVSNLMTSSMTEYANPNTWRQFCKKCDLIVFDGELSDIVSFDRCAGLKNMKVVNVYSKNSEIVPSLFLQASKFLINITFSNATQASLPEKFLSRSKAEDVDFILNVENVRRHSLDSQRGVKSLNGVLLDDVRKQILTGNDKSSKCTTFCANNDCGAEVNKIARKNCAICARNHDGPDEQHESEICNYRSTSVPPTVTVPPPSPSLVSYINPVLL